MTHRVRLRRGEPRFDQLPRRLVVARAHQQQQFHHRMQHQIRRLAQQLRRHVLRRRPPHIKWILARRQHRRHHAGNPERRRARRKPERLRHAALPSAVHHGKRIRGLTAADAHRLVIQQLRKALRIVRRLQAAGQRHEDDTADLRHRLAAEIRTDVPAVQQCEEALFYFRRQVALALGRERSAQRADRSDEQHLVRLCHRLRRAQRIRLPRRGRHISHRRQRAQQRQRRAVLAKLRPHARRQFHIRRLVPVYHHGERRQRQQRLVLRLRGAGLAHLLRTTPEQFRHRLRARFAQRARQPESRLLHLCKQLLLFALGGGQQQRRCGKMRVLQTLRQLHARTLGTATAPLPALHLAARFRGKLHQLRGLRRQQRTQHGHEFLFIESARQHRPVQWLEPRIRKLGALAEHAQQTRLRGLRLAF